MADYAWKVAGHIVLAAVLGALIGLERARTGPGAQLRTTILVAVGSCVLTVLSIDVYPLLSGSQDMESVAAQIVAGVGILGAGALVNNRSQVQGLITATTFWLAAAIGMAVGAGLYLIAIFTTLLTTTLLAMLRPLSARLQAAKRRRREAHKRVRRRLDDPSDNGRGG